MKIITQGDPDRKWWTGLQARCATCNALVELAVDDKPIATAANRMAVFECPCCHSNDQHGAVTVFRQEP